jgi:hypothetical protein
MKYLKRFENYNDLEDENLNNRDIEEDLLIIKDILADLEDSHGINFDISVGKFFKDSSVRNLWGSVPVRGGIHVNSININLDLLTLEEEEGKYFIFNEQILPTINTIKSHLEEVNIVIVKNIGDLFYDSSKNKYYPLDEFIKEHGSEEFNELEIILY